MVSQTIVNAYKALSVTIARAAWLFKIVWCLGYALWRYSNDEGVEAATLTLCPVDLGWFGIVVMIDDANEHRMPIWV